MSFRTYISIFLLLTLSVVAVVILDWRTYDTIPIGEFGLPKPALVLGFFAILWIGSFVIHFMPRDKLKDPGSGQFLMWCVLLTSAFILLDKSVLYAYNMGWTDATLFKRMDMAFYGFFIMLMANFQTKTLPPMGKTPEETHLIDTRFRASSRAVLLFGLSFVIIWLATPVKEIAIGLTISAMAITASYILWRFFKDKNAVV
ncbi:hypothetical protein [Hirschia litorea]|uniref:Uncharacterized protein n=1 Tax=Hirschia litorea TaxID=1199156 RepID=A0ABW2IKM5_9PROT